MTAVRSAWARYAGHAKENNLDTNVRRAWNFPRISLCFAGHRLSAANTNSIEVGRSPLRRPRLDGRSADGYGQNGRICIAFTTTAGPSKRARATAAAKIADIGAYA